MYDALPAVGGLPVRAVCMALGVPRQDWPLFARWAWDMALDEMYAYVDVMVADRCVHPRADLLSWLISVDIHGDGDGLTADQVRAVVAALLIAGRR